MPTTQSRAAIEILYRVAYARETFHYLGCGPVTQDHTINPNNAITPFLIHQSNVRGRMVRMQDTLDTILTTHDYPEQVSQLLGEGLMIVAMLASNLKHNGVFTLQARGDGPIGMVVADAVFGGGLRGYAAFDDTKLSALLSEEETPSLAQLMGQGHLAITLDAGGKNQRYQGVVGLEGTSISEAITHYFTQSQQIDVKFHIALGRDKATWRGGAMMIERLPEGVLPMDRDAVDDIQEVGEEEWRAAYSMMHTLSDEELIDIELSPAELLYRLYNADGVWVHDALPLHHECRCSRGKVESALRTIARNEIEALKREDGLLSVVCEFCKSEELFDELQLERLYK